MNFAAERIVPVKCPPDAHRLLREKAVGNWSAYKFLAGNYQFVLGRNIRDGLIKLGYKYVGWHWQDWYRYQHPSSGELVAVKYNQGVFVVHFQPEYDDDSC